MSKLIGHIYPKLLVIISNPHNKKNLSKNWDRIKKIPPILKQQVSNTLYYFPNIAVANTLTTKIQVNLLLQKNPTHVNISC